MLKFCRFWIVFCAVRLVFRGGGWLEDLVVILLPDIWFFLMLNKNVCLVPHCEALRTCCSAFPITTKWCFDQDAKAVPGATFTRRTCNRCSSLQKQRDVVATSRLALHWKCGFRMPNTWKWPETNMYLDLKLATFQYIDGFGCHHFCLTRIGLELKRLE